jgi:hypothetical protein
MPTKIVKRRYYNKTLGEYVTKTYEYDKSGSDKSGSGKNYYSDVKKRSKRSLLIVGTGKNKIYQDRLESLLSQTDDLAVKADIMGRVREAEAKGLKLSERSLISAISGNKIEKMIINTGYSVEDLAKELNVTEDQLLNQKNWQKGGIFNAPGGKQYQYKHGYTGRVMRVVK